MCGQEFCSGLCSPVEQPQKRCGHLTCIVIFLSLSDYLVIMYSIAGMPCKGRLEVMVFETAKMRLIY